MIFRVEKNKYYTIMTNYHLRDKRLSLQSKGLLSLILSFPDECDFKRYDINTFTSTKDTGIKTAMNELIEYGYIEKYKIRKKNGQFDTIYNVNEYPNIEERPELKIHSGKSTPANINKVNIYRNTNNKKQVIDEPEWLEEYKKNFEATVEDL